MNKIIYLILYIPFIFSSYLLCRKIYEEDNFKSNNIAFICFICCFIPILNLILNIACSFYLLKDTMNKKSLNKLFLIKGDKDEKRKFKGKGYS